MTPCARVSSGPPTGGRLLVQGRRPPRWPIRAWGAPERKVAARAGGASVRCRGGPARGSHVRRRFVCGRARGARSHDNALGAAAAPARAPVRHGVAHRWVRADCSTHCILIAHSLHTHRTLIAHSPLPTGGFAHSGGLEAALQFGLLGTRRGAPMAASLRELGTTAALHAVWLQAPFALAAHQLLAEALPHLRPSSGAAAGTSSGAVVGGAWPADHVETALAVAMAALNAQQHALLAANGPACRASMLQGSTLSRIATNWLGGAQHGAHGQDGADGTGGAAAAAARGVLALPARQAHGAPALGALAALLGLPARSAVDAFIYMTTRDFVSAAVRLNLIGPLAAISLQSEVVSDVARRSADVMQLGCAGAAGSAPLPLVIPLPLMSTEDQ